MREELALLLHKGELVFDRLYFGRVKARVARASGTAEEHVHSFKRGVGLASGPYRSAQHVGDRILGHSLRA
jgi:hypothetical protein